MARIPVEQYDERWPAIFEAERLQLEQLLGPWLSDGVHHIGSTSIQGIAAKPYIDMMAGVASFDDAAEAIPVLVAAGWSTSTHRPQTHHFLKPGYALHLLEPSHPLWVERLSFRDALRSDDVLRDEYAAIKLRLAEQTQDMSVYTLGKADFVRRVLAANGVTLEDWRART